jgi:hypothetical protein
MLALLAAGGLAAASLAAAPPALADGPGAGAPWVVSVGDSYISGEAGRWAGNTDKSSSIIDALGKTAYDDNATHTAELINRCHRSWSAEVFIGAPVSGMTLACSGAKTSTFTNSDGDFKPGLDFYADSKGRQGQAAMLEAFARSHNVKMVPLSIGGNNFNFGDVVTQCVKDFLKPWVRSRYLCKEDSTVLANFKPANVNAQIAAMKTGILNIRLAMSRAGYADSAYTILVQNYEAAIPRGGDFRYSQSGVTRQSTGGCGIYNADADWANSTALPTINNAVRSAAGQSGLSNVKLLDLSKAFSGHALCARGVGLLEEQGLASWRSPGAVDKTEWIDQIRTVTVGTPYFRQESLHPNYWGQLALRNCIRQAYDGGNPRGGTCTIASTGVNAQGEPRMTIGQQPGSPTVSPGAGNPNGGTPAAALCPQHYALTGMTLHMNGSVGSVNGICRSVVFGMPTITGAATVTTPRIGHTGSRDVTVSCPRDFVVTGFSGRSGLLVDAVGLYCSRLSNDTPVMTTRTSDAGGAGGSPFPEKGCTSGAAVGLYGRSGNDLDYLALECATVS